MYIILNHNDIDKKNILFGYKMKNNIIENSYFYNIIYSNNICSLNNIIMTFQIYDCKIENSFNKHKLIFNKHKNKTFLNNINKIEKKILSCFESKKEPIYNLYENVKDGNFTYFDNNYKYNVKNNSTFIKIKFTGIWKNSSNYGLIYKIFL